MTFLLLLLPQYFWAAEQVFLELFLRDKKAFLVGTLYLIVEVAAMCRTIFRSSNCHEFALSFLSLDIELANGFALLLLVCVGFNFLLLV